jgi:hypothetical protein
VDQVVDAVRAAARGESVLQPAATARLLRELRTASADPLAQLTRRETDVLKGLAQGRSNRDIARAPAPNGTFFLDSRLIAAVKPGLNRQVQACEQANPGVSGHLSVGREG